MFQFEAGIKMSHVPYRGEAGAINDLVAGQIPAMFANLSAVGGQLAGGTVRGLAVTSPQRAPSAPNIPTVAETLPGYAADTWFGIVAPQDTPRRVIDKLNAAAQKALAQDDTKKRYADVGMTIAGPAAIAPESLMPISSPRSPNGRKLSTTPTSNRWTRRVPFQRESG